jgi:hypothetical protein
MVPALMDADWSVELGRDDPALEFPWCSPDGSRRYIDLRQSPELVSEIPEAARCPELAQCLIALNATTSAWQTVKCDVWPDDELGAGELIYDARVKFCSYVDLIARNALARFSFERHECFVKSAARQFSDDDEQPINCELTVRRCRFHGELVEDDLTPGFYVTFYLFGYGSDEAQARARWGEGLRRGTSILIGLAP